MKVVCWFILEDIIYCYGSIGRMRADQSELNVVKAHDFFTKYRVQLKLITYNPKAYDKIKFENFIILKFKLVLQIYKIL